MGMGLSGAVKAPPAEAPLYGSFMQPSVNSLEVPPAKRLSYWKSNVDRHSGMDIRCSTANFVGSMVTRSFGLCAIHGVEISTAHRAVRARSRENLCFAHVQVRNDGARFNGNREMAIPQGSMIIYDAAEPYELEFDGASQSLVLTIPKSDLLKRVTDLQMHIDEQIRYDPHKVAMLAGLMGGLLASPVGQRQSVLDGLAESVISLLVATLYDCDETVSHGAATFGTAATLQRIKAYIKTHIDDPDLNPVKTADAMGITVSYLHKIFLQNNTTLMQYVLAERLELCRRDIAKADRTGGISQVAYNWGFNDASHFSRSFRKRFGISPREYRAEVLQRNARIDHSPPSD
ncbi:helix-turn-helix domain-containing protein [Martelella sp. HB161492]|uniref:helix-turn-helix domain-containing protein n=1 Tax=Martelella sp. HB161492 TaxID=2720726 RepID=UPI0015918E68|nr:helix-turn-helix domain-containing protein [Martelella sp. HB161492]